MASEEQGKKIRESLLDQILKSVESGQMRLLGIDPAPAELSREEIQNRLSQLPPGALPGIEQYLRGRLRELDEDEPFDLKSYYDGEVAKGLAEMTEPKTVPLTIYIDNQMYIVGKATVVGKKVLAKIDVGGERNLERLISAGIINGVSVTFSTEGPAHPEQEFAAEEIKNYTFEPTDPIKHIPDIEKEPINYVGLESKPTVIKPPFDATLWFRTVKVPRIEGLTADHTLEDEEPFQDKFPYGPK
jgi:hypothetical protein